MSVKKVWAMLKMRWCRFASIRQVEALLRRVDAIPPLDTRTPDEILGYDERGLPR